MATSATGQQQWPRDHILHEEQRLAARRWFRIGRLLMLSFHTGAWLLLAARGFSGLRVTIHAALLLVLAWLSWRPIDFAREPVKALILLVVLGGVSLNTGGLVSPLSPWVLGAVPVLAWQLERRRDRWVLAGTWLAVLLALVVFSRSAFGQLVAPLAPRDSQTSLEYLGLSVVSLASLGAVLFVSWSAMSSTYRQVAVELGTRREELCSESEQQLRDMEGAAAIVSHELRNPLASIKCLAAHMARGALEPKTVERLDTIRAEADRLDGIIDEFVRVKRSLSELSLATMRPYAVARKLQLLLHGRVTEANVTLKVSGDRDVEIEADPKKLHRALFHLVLNAVQASAPGQMVTIQVNRLTTERVSIEIVDRGEGMSGNVLERILRPYYSTRKNGIGLGIAVARTLVERHGGRLAYRSEVGKGTTATIELPRRTPEGHAAPNQAIAVIRAIELSAGEGKRE